MENLVQSVAARLFAEEESNVYAVLDGASVPGLLQNLQSHQPEHFCLYRGELAPDMAEVAPYLIHLQPDAEFTDWLVARGWGQHWGIYATSAADIRALRRHFRAVLIVYDEENKPVYFRYYDPRVLRLYLPTCNAEELTMIFGPVESFLLEDDDAKTMLRFQTASGSLKQEKIALA